MTMMENQNAASFDSESFGRKEKHELIDSRMDASSIKFEAKDGDESLKCQVMDDFAMDNDNGTIDSPTKEGQNGQLHHLGGWDKDADSLSSDSYDMDKEQRSPEHDSSEKFAEFADYNETDTNLFTDKNVLECEVPELEVCYKEIDCQTLKDICVDEGRPDKDINLVENDSKKLDSQCGSKEENDSEKLDSQGRIESSLDNSFEKDTDNKHCDPEDSVQTGDCGAFVKAVTDSSEDDSLVDRKLPIEDSGDGNEAMQPPDQILDKKPVSESPAEAGETGEVVKANSLLYNSKVESQSITFNFKSHVPNNGNDATENINEHSADSDDSPKDVNAENLQGSPEVQEQKDTTNSDNSSTYSPAQIPTKKSESSENDVQPVEPNVPQHEQKDTGNVTVVSQLQRDEGETSFSAASLITYSGPIAFSGSLSHRSDGSTTSAKSFAFPVLQSEWNSSPVRMAKADRRNFRKHKGWRSGLLCCRF